MTKLDADQCSMWCRITYSFLRYWKELFQLYSLLTKNNEPKATSTNILSLPAYIPTLTWRGGCSQQKTSAKQAGLPSDRSDSLLKQVKCVTAVITIMLLSGAGSKGSHFYKIPNFTGQIGRHDGIVWHSREGWNSVPVETNTVTLILGLTQFCAQWN